MNGGWIDKVHNRHPPTKIILIMASVALGEGTLTDEENALIIDADRLRNDVIQVSDFDPDSYSELR